MKTLIIIPAYNEQNSIGDLVTAINDLGIDYIVINDCSCDGMVEVLKSMNAKYINLPVNLGIGGAVQTGYKYAANYNYDIAIQIDGDGQHDISYIPEIIRMIENEKVDIVIGSRFLKKEGFQSSITRRMGIRFLSRLIKFVCGLNITDVTSGYRAVNKKFINIYSETYSMDYPEPEAIVTAAMQRGIIVEVPVIMKERTSGTSSINIRKSIYYMVKVSLAILICKISAGQKSIKTVKN